MFIVKSIIPFNLSNYYPYPSKGASMHLPAGFYFSAMSGIVFSAVLFRAFRRKMKLQFLGMAFFASTIGPVIQIMAVGETIMSDRYCYIPFIGLFMLQGYLFEWIHEHKKSWFPIVAALTAVIMVALALGARQRCIVWRNSKNLWTNCLSNYPPHSN